MTLTAILLKTIVLYFVAAGALVFHKHIAIDWVGSTIWKTSSNPYGECEIYTWWIWTGFFSKDGYEGDPSLSKGGGGG